MRTLGRSLALLILPLPFCALGCASTTGTASKVQTVASIGDKPLPVVSGTPGAIVAADRAAPGPRATREGRISGRVLDEDGAPVPNVRVRLAVSGAAGGKVVRATTDPSGAFTLHGLRPGSTYTVIAESDDADGPLTGRAEARAPDSDVRISLAPADAEGGRAVASNSKARRVSPISERASSDDEDHPGGVNQEDLPPASEAETLAPRSGRRTASAGPGTRSARWHRGAPSRSRPKAAEDEDEGPPPADPETRGTSAESEGPPPAEDGANPLPPALEPGQASAAPPRELPREAQVIALAAGPMPPAPPDEPPPSEPTPLPDQAPPPAGALVVVPEESGPATAPAEPPVAVATEPAPPTEAVVSAPASFSPVAEPVALPPEPAPAPVVAEAEPAPIPPGSRPRMTWRELTRSAPKFPDDEGTRLTSAESVATAEPPPRASPPADDGRAYCRYDNRLRRLEDFRLPDLQGRPVRFLDLDADLVLLDFWGTWCNPCVRSIPHLVDLQRRLGPAKLKVVGIACEQGPAKTRAEAVSKTVRMFGINYEVLLSGMDGPCPVQSAFQVQAFPTMILLDREGRVIWRDQGATPTTLARLDRFLASTGKPETSRRY